MVAPECGGGMEIDSRLRRALPKPAEGQPCPAGGVRAGCTRILWCNVARGRVVRKPLSYEDHVICEGVNGDVADRQDVLMNWTGSMPSWRSWIVPWRASRSMMAAHAN